MAEERKRLLKELLPFEALEAPKWRKTEDIPVKEMVAKIMEYSKEWEGQKKDNYETDLIEQVYQDFLVEFILHVNMEEEKGFSTFEETDAFLKNCHDKGITSKSQQETLNVKKAYEHLLDKIKREEEPRNYGLMEESLLQETHRILLQDVPLGDSRTKPGIFSNQRRFVDFEGERYNYPYLPEPEKMEKAVVAKLEKCNILFDCCTKDGLKDFDDFYYLFKTCGWMLFELLDLHPFGDGNGRLFRILCSYLLSKFSPFPTPVYNVWTDSTKDDYLEALVRTRKTVERHPTALTTMIIECSYYGWRKFFERLEEKKRFREN
ncbi:uncharacterized protein [Porites lutea]|uniref:uncharacterized protein n=1 Tax=Porites lutea TaxID=51062 RepID=UPI003CC5990C